MERLTMQFTKTEVNLMRLLAFTPRQQNPVKLVHYISTLRELLEHLGSDSASGVISNISKVKRNEYSEKIEALASKLNSLMQVPVETVVKASMMEGNPSQIDEDRFYKHPSVGIRRRVETPSETDDTREPIKLDASVQDQIEKHRNIQKDLTDELVGFAQQLKESSFMTQQSLHDAEKILGSTEKALEGSLVGTGRANTQAMQLYSGSSKTTCFTWFTILAMTCIFTMVVLLIRLTMT